MRWKILLALLLIALGAHAQHADWEMHVNPRRVQKILPLDNDSLLIATLYTGLIKMHKTNGGRTVINKFNSSIPYNGISDMVRDSSGFIWFSFRSDVNYGGIASFDGTNYTLYDHTNSVLPHGLSSILVTASNEIYGLNGKNVYFFNGSSWNVLNQPQPFANSFKYDLTVDSAGTIYFSDSHGIVAYDGNSFNLKDTTIEETIYFLKCDVNSDRLYIGTGKGVYSRHSLGLDTILFNVSIRDLEVIGEDSILFCTFDALYLYDGSNIVKWDTSSHPDIPYPINHLYYDGEIWVGGPELLKLTDSGNVVFPVENENIPPFYARAASPDSKGNILSFQSSVLYKFNGVEWNSIKSNFGAAGYASGSAEDSKGNLWIKPEKAATGLIKYDGSDFKFVHMTTPQTTMSYFYEFYVYDTLIYTASPSDIIQYDGFSRKLFYSFQNPP